VVDVQRGCGWPTFLGTGSALIQKVGGAILQIIQSARRASTPIVFLDYDKRDGDEEVQYDFGEKCLSCSHEDGIVLSLEHRHDASFEPVFFKKDINGFSNPHLAPYLRSLGTTVVQIVGCATDVCVLATARGALAEKFDVEILEEGVFPPFEGEAVKNRWIDSILEKKDNPRRSIKIEKARIFQAPIGAFSPGSVLDSNRINISARRTAVGRSPVLASV